MPSHSSSNEAGPEPAQDVGDATLATTTPGALVAAALGGDLAGEALFWRARAEELAARLAHLEKRLQALSGCLPARWAQLVVCDPAEMPDHVSAPDPLAGWRETTELTPSRVASVLPRLWDRLDPGAS